VLLGGVVLALALALVLVLALLLLLSAPVRELRQQGWGVLALVLLSSEPPEKGWARRWDHYSSCPKCSCT